MNPRPGGKAAKILFIPLEFMTWGMARHLSHSFSLGFEDGFQAHGLDFLTLPGLCAQSTGVPGDSRSYWLDRARSLCRGMRFDQVWVEAVHAHLDDDTLDWIAGLAPVRVALVGESLEYQDHIKATAPHLLQRKSLVEKRLAAFTHCLAADETDADNLARKGPLKAMWWASVVSEKFIGKVWNPHPEPRAIFAGSVYGERKSWLEDPGLMRLLVHQSFPREEAAFAARFDDLHSRLAAYLDAGKAATWDRVSGYLSPLRRIRHENFANWIKSLANGMAVVNLPSFFHGYAGRVVEAMAAGRPVVSWQIPDRPRNLALFRDGEDILLFRSDDREKLREHLERLVSDPGFGRRIAANATRKLWLFHTMEKRVGQVLDWIETDREPVYQEKAGGSDLDQAFAAFHAGFADSPNTATREEIPDSTPMAMANPRSDVVKSARKLPYPYFRNLSKGKRAMPDSNLRILFIPLEFQDWSRARHVSYASFLGWEEAFRGCNLDVTTLPANVAYSAGESDSGHRGYWLDSMRSLCAGKVFDQVWAEVVHSRLDADMLGFISAAAPVRIALIGESLCYSQDAGAAYPHLAGRKSLVESRLRAFTHALAADEKDAADLNGRGVVNALWTPPAVPERFLDRIHGGDPSGSAFYPQASDLELSPWLGQGRLAGLLKPQPSSDQEAAFSRDFDSVQSQIAGALGSGKASWPLVQAYLDPIHAIHSKSFELNLESSRLGNAVVNLPSFLQAYGIRVFEGMAAGCPVISWDITDRPRNRSLFLDGEDILLFPKGNPEKLAIQIESLVRDPKAALRISRNATRKLWRFHTSEKRIVQILSWLENGEKPVLEERDWTPSVAAAMETFRKGIASHAELQAAAIAQPGNAAAQLALAESHLGSGSFREASMAFLKAIEADPKDIRSWNKCARACLAEGNTAMAKVAVEGALALDPANAEAKSLSRDLHAALPDTGASGHLNKSDIDGYYEEFFLRSPEYASREPNIEELARWNKIEPFLRRTKEERAAQGKGPLRILDLGCGRGWLTNKASQYGEAEGMEPVAGVIAGSRKLFPNLKFYACEAAQLRQDPSFRPYDLILNSEVIEHVPWGHKDAFVDALKSLLKPDGIVILTTPRGEVFEEYMRLVNNLGQPIEDWVTEDQTRSYFQKRGFQCEGPERIWARFPECVYFPSATPEQEKSQRLMAIYQIWRFRLA